MMPSLTQASLWHFGQFAIKTPLEMGVAYNDYINLTIPEYLREKAHRRYTIAYFR